MAMSRNIVLISQDDVLSSVLVPCLEELTSVDISRCECFEPCSGLRDLSGMIVLDVAGSSPPHVKQMMEDYYQKNNQTDLPPLVLLCDEAWDKNAASVTGTLNVLNRLEATDLLASQIKHVHSSWAENAEIKSQLANARNVALLSMAASSQLGEVLRFQEQSYQVDTYAELGEKLHESLKALGVEAVGLLFAENDTVIFGSEDQRDEKESQLRFSECGERYVDHDDGTMLFFDNAWVHVAGMPPKGSSEFGQLKDVLFPLLESTCMRVSVIRSDRKVRALERNKVWFLRNVSHELRNPMDAILSGLTLLSRATLKGDDSESQRTTKIVALMDDSATRLKDRIEDLLALGDMDKLTITRRNVVLTDELDDIVPFYSELARKKAITFDCTIDTLEEKVFVDPRQLKQIIRCLLSNAVKYTHEGRVQLAIKTVSSEDSEMLLVSVKDSGVGISESKIKHFLSPLSEMDLSVTQMGTGIGLSVACQLLQYMKGTVRVESQEGIGSEFVMEIPIDYSEESEQFLFG